MALQIIRNNIINVSADAIVNTANPNVAVGPGVDRAIYEAAGWDKLFEDRKKIGAMDPGDVAYTPAYDLDAKYIIHAIGPAWRGGSFGEREIVALCYSRSLALAKELGCESIAFPLMATGTYGFPKDEALKIAIREISSFLLANEMEVLLVVYDRESFDVSGRLFTDIKSFIEDSEIKEQEEMISQVPGDSGRILENRRMRQENRILRRKQKAVDSSGTAGNAIRPLDVTESFDESRSYGSSFDVFGSPDMDMAFPSESKSLEERLKHLDKTFQEYLFMLIDRKGLNDPDVYKKANIDRKHFSKIRNNKDYVPSKKTALALAIALELGLDETKDLLGRAGLALSPSSTFDKIVEYCIDNGEYDIYEINCVLFKYDQDTLGA